MVSSLQSAASAFFRFFDTSIKKVKVTTAQQECVLPNEILDRIFLLADNPAAVSLACKRFYAVQSDVLCGRYNKNKSNDRPFFEMGQPAAIQDQQAEIDFLLKEEEYILNVTSDTRFAEDATSCLEKLKSSQIQSTEIRKFLARENLIDTLNSAIYGAKGVKQHAFRMTKRPNFSLPTRMTKDMM